MRAGLAAQLSLLAALCNAQDPAQERARQFKALADEIQIGTPDAATRLTLQYLDDHVSEMHRIVQREILETLNQTDKLEDVRKAVKSLIGDDPFGNKELPYVYSSSLQGLKTIVVGYTLPYSMGPKVMIDGFRKAGLTYELAAGTGEALSGCVLQLKQLDPPRSNEAWFLGYGLGIGGSRQWYSMRIYSFDGYEFKELWAPDRPRLEPIIETTKDLITIKYGDESREPALQDTIRLTVAGPIVTTTSRQP